MKRIISVLVALILGVSVVSAASYSKTGSWFVKTSYIGLDYFQDDEFFKEASEVEGFDREACEAALANNELYTFVFENFGFVNYGIVSSESVTLVSLDCDSFSVSLRELIRTGAFQKAVNLGNNLYYLVNWNGTTEYYFVY